MSAEKCKYAIVKLSEKIDNYERKIYDDLIEWKNTKKFKPLIVLGVRQCGKTYIIDEFCKKEYKNYKKINLLENTEVVELYKSNESSEKKYNDLKLLLDFDFDKENSILFIDEIQVSEELIFELKFFNEKHSNVRLICAGSLLGIKMARLNKPFPVGNGLFNQKPLLERIEECFNKNEPMGLIHNKALDYYRRYLLSGGMPDSVIALL